MPDLLPGVKCVCFFYMFIHQWALDVSSVCMRFSYLLAVVLGNVGQVAEECLPVLISLISSGIVLLGAVFRPLHHTRIYYPGGCKREHLFYCARCS